MEKNEKRSFIYKLDILSGNPGIYISGNKNYSTLFGLSVTFLIILVGVIYASYALYIYFYESEMSVVEQSENFMTADIKISTKDFLFAFNVFNVSMKMQYFWGKELNLLSGQNLSKKFTTDNYTVKLYYENPETKTVLKEYYLTTEYCEIGKNINKEIIDKYNFKDYEKYLCISEKSNTEIIINKDYNTYIDVIVSINLNNSTDGVKREIEHTDETSITFKMNYLQFELYTPNDIITNKNSSSPINFRKNFFYYELISSGTIKTTEIITKYIDYQSDNGYIIKRLNNFSGFSIESIQTKIQDLSSIDIVKSIIYNEFRLYFNGDNIAAYQRTYRKLPEIIADISGVVSLLITVGQIGVSFLCQNYLELKILSQLFRSKLFEDPKIKLKQKNVIKLKNADDPKSSRKESKNNFIDNSIKKNIIVYKKNSKSGCTNINIIYEKNNESNNINDDLSKNIMISKNDLAIKRNTQEKNYNKKIDNRLNNSEDDKNNKDNDKNISKKNTDKIDPKI